MPDLRRVETSVRMQSICLSHINNLDRAMAAMGDRKTQTIKFSTINWLPDPPRVMTASRHGLPD
ncbi:hypothetical protein TNIN_231671, partial [Trichonephila inaurata madagascariensis]